MLFSTVALTVVLSFPGILFPGPSRSGVGDGGLPGNGLCASETSGDADVLRPGSALDYAPLAFEPKRWEDRGIPTSMVPWEGKQVVFLTTANATLDAAVVTRFVRRLDEGWKLYAELTGRSPSPFKEVSGKPLIAAVPDGDLTCGYGCGFVGSTGIEIAGFYSSDYPLLARSPKAFPHYAFYEMGRNYYTFGNRHSCFVTGYAVFMRYVCMDSLGCEDPDRTTRRTIERAEDVYSKAGSPTFLQAFTNLDGLDEKRDRLRGVSPSDQPVMYASAMLRLHRLCGGNAWLKRFYAALAECPEVKPDSRAAGLRQSFHWYVASSLAARRDLGPIFCDRWRLPLSPGARKAAAQVPWKKEGLHIEDALAAIPLDSPR